MLRSLFPGNARRQRDLTTILTANRLVRTLRAREGRLGSLPLILVMTTLGRLFLLRPPAGNTTAQHSVHAHGGIVAERR